MATMAMLPIPAEAPDGSFPAGFLVGGRYVIVRPLGAGATGAVYEVHDAAIPERRLALKILHHAAGSASEREAQVDELRAMAQVRHPSIIALYDHGMHEGRLFSVLPLMRGEELEGRTFSRAEVRRIGTMLAEALAAMHEVGLTHQDIKPENARLTQFDGVPEETPILLDLGTAVRIGTKMRGFSPAFLAPEIALALVEGRGAPLADPKADVYSLAATLHSMLETPPPEPEGELVVFLVARSEGVPPKFRERRLRYLDSYFARWMAADPEARPTASQLARELEVLVAPESFRRKVAFFGVLLAVLGVVIGIAVWQVRQADAATAEVRAHARQVESERRAAEQRANAAQSELGTTRTALDDASGRVDTLTQDAARLAAEAQKERSEAESTDARARRLSKTVQEMTVIVAELRAALADERQLRDRYAQQVRDRESQLGAAQALQRETAAARDQAANEAARMAGRAATLQDALDRSESSLAQLRAELERTRASLSAELADSQQRASALDAQLRDVERRLDACQAAPPPPSGLP